ncbi:MAG TPA: hypothetical protein VEH81_11285, partial [Ktedonobacteraceae bacterium]|nr:hypothetical protein [Ktedonobacteraceae bacterium]
PPAFVVRSLEEKTSGYSLPCSFTPIVSVLLLSYFYSNRPRKSRHIPCHPEPGIVREKQSNTSLHSACHCFAIDPMVVLKNTVHGERYVSGILVKIEI